MLGRQNNERSGWQRVAETIKPIARVQDLGPAGNPAFGDEVLDPAMGIALVDGWPIQRTWVRNDLNINERHMDIQVGANTGMSQCGSRKFGRRIGHHGPKNLLLNRRRLGLLLVT
jgi:hypothetical protein